MPRIYKPVGPSANKVAVPVTENKTPAVAPQKDDKKAKDDEKTGSDGREITSSAR
jgi:hypothetical protein